LDVETKIDLVLREPTEEVLTRNELRTLLETNPHPRHYIGFEISGLLHLGTLFVCGYKVNDLIEAGIDCTVYLADWHSFINNKLGGNWDNIITASKYFGEGFRFFCPEAKIVLGSDLYHDNDEYWRDIMRFSRQITLARDTRCLTIMGRSIKESLNFAQFLYPPMQAVDVKYLGPDIPHGGMDQRKVHVLCREVYPKLGWKKPIPLHNHLLMGLEAPDTSMTKRERLISAKMSKSKPWTCIYIHDSEEEIKAKINKAYCPEKDVEMNPIIEITRYILFREKKSLLVTRPSKFGGDVEYTSFKELEKAYAKGELHPKDLKTTVAEELNKAIAPVREHFENRKELLEVFKKN
jgi:tyrosyl-tRNA synthetase